MPGEAEAGRVWLDVVPRLQQGFGNAVEQELEGPFGRLRSRFDGLGRMLATGLAVGVGAGAVALFGAAGQIDDALDSIAISTGATGERLDSLEGNFRNVARTSASSFDDVATAVGDLSRRTEATGGDLERLATQELNLARLTREDLGATIENSTRLFADWGVSVEDQGSRLDMLLRTSQLTGVGVNDLAGTLVTFGGPLRQLGFSLEESSALVGTFAREGVNAELVMGSMRQALGRMARAGEAPAETFRRVTWQIENAGSAGEANALALELFGARAGPDMAAAIREGRFEIDGLVAQLGESEGAIAATAAQTDGFSETFARLKNRVLLAVEPLATRFLQILEELLPKIEPVVEWIGDRLPAAFESIRSAVAPIVEGLVIFGTALAEDLEPAARRIFAFLREHARPILAALGIAIAVLVSPIGVVIGALALAYQRFEGFRNVVDTVLRVVAGAGAFLVEQFSTFVTWAREVWPQVSEAISHVLEAVRVVLDVWVAYVRWLWSNFGDELLAVVRIVWDQIRNAIDLAVNTVRSVIELVLALINGDWGRAWQAVKDLLGGVWDYIIGTVTNGARLMREAIELALSLVRAAWDLAWQGITAALGIVWEGIKTAVSTGIGAVVDFFRNLPGDIIAAVGNIAERVGQIGRDAVTGILNAILERGADLAAWFAELPGRIIEWVGNVASRVAEIGRMIVRGIADAIRAAASWVSDAVGDVLSQIPGISALQDAPGIGRIIPGATGGFIMEPLVGLFGEAGPELLLPLTDRRRALELLGRSGLLDGDLGGVGPAVRAVEAGAAGTGDRGPAVVVEEQHLHDEVDLELFLSEVGFYATAGQL